MNIRAGILGFLSALMISACGESPPTSLSLGPHRDEWYMAVDTEFTYQDGDGNPLITSVIIGGGRTSDGNFANQGDVIVKADGPNGYITVEMRKFAWVESEDAAEEAFPRLELWAFSTNVDNPRPPDDMDPGADCSVDGWQEGCGIRVYYDGQLEPQRFGADLRVTLPEEYRHNINVFTSDNDFDDDYLNRGNVCISNLNGTADVELEQGLAFVILDEDTSPAPACPPDDIEACENATDPDTGDDAAWNENCPCYNYTHGFGAAKVESPDGAAASVTFDVPSDLWAVFSLTNDGENQSPECVADVLWDEAELEPQDRPWKKRGEANHPAAAIAGFGFSITGISGDCANVLFTEDPEDYKGDGKSDEQAAETRGNLTLCDGCARDRSCDELLAGEG
jgi:hypothetical protein